MTPEVNSSFSMIPAKGSSSSMDIFVVCNIVAITMQRKLSANAFPGHTLKSYTRNIEDLDRGYENMHGHTVSHIQKRDLVLL